MIIGLINPRAAGRSLQGDVREDGSIMKASMPLLVCTAFYTTLMGAILGGVCLRLLSNLVDANTEHIVSHIAS